MNKESYTPVDGYLANPNRFIGENEVPYDESERRNLNEIEKGRAQLEGRDPVLIKVNPIRLARAHIERIRNARAAKREYESLDGQLKDFQPKLQDLAATLQGLRLRLDAMNYPGTAAEAIEAIASDRADLEAAQLLEARYMAHNIVLNTSIREAAEAAGVEQTEAIRSGIAEDKRVAATRLGRAAASATDLDAWETQVESADLEELETELAEQGVQQ